MAIVTSTPDVAELGDAVRVMRGWQHDGAPMQLHPGDLGWRWRFGGEATAAAVRLWLRDGQVVAVGLLDDVDVLRVTTAPQARRDEELAAHLVADLTEPARGLLPAGRANVEVPADALVRDLLGELGWGVGEPWTPLSRDLADPVDDAGLRVETVGPHNAAERVAVQRASFDTSTFTEELWQTMAAAPPYAEARCLLGYDDDGVPVAALSVWSAGAGRPGLIEPMGVHREHRGNGYGTAIVLAGARALRELGSSSMVVATPSALVGAVATYRSAGMQSLPEIHDRVRPG